MRHAAALILVAALSACTAPSSTAESAAPPEPPTSDTPDPPTTPPPTTTTTTAPPTTTTTAPPPPPSPPTTTTASAEVRTAAASAPVVATGDCGPWRDLIASHFPAEQVGKACAVMRCETGGTFDPGIHNPRSSASGLFQFLDSTWRSVTGTAPPAAAYAPETQVAAAAKLWRSSGWRPWACA